MAVILVQALSTKIVRLQAEVQNIISSVIKELAWNPDRKFIYVEQVCFTGTGSPECNNIYRRFCRRFFNVGGLKLTLRHRLLALSALGFANCCHVVSFAPVQTLTQQLVASGQLEFINGGWCMHDEANPSFVDMIDQTTLGELAAISHGLNIYHPYTHSHTHTLNVVMP